MCTTEEAQQVGGLGRVSAMIGAYNFASHKEGALSFRFKAKALQIDGKSPNYIKITLAPSDTYTVTFGRIYGRVYTELQTFPETYCDQLQGLLEDVTGLCFTLHGLVQFG